MNWQEFVNLPKPPGKKLEAHTLAAILVIILVVLRFSWEKRDSFPTVTPSAIPPPSWINANHAK